MYRRLDVLRQAGMNVVIMEPIVRALASSPFIPSTGRRRHRAPRPRALSELHVIVAPDGEPHEPFRSSLMCMCSL